jgi:S-adenosylmethionine hydrolase
MVCYLITDFGPGDLANAEVIAALFENVPGVDNVVNINVNSFDTYAAALAISQLANKIPKDDFIYHNVAPRRDNASGRINNDGEKLSYGITNRGVKIIGPNSDPVYGLISDKITDFFFVDCASGGSQFRSRDVFPLVIGDVLKGERLERNQLPEPIIEGVVLLTDSFGNIKTNWINPPKPSDDFYTIEIADSKASALAVDSAFAAQEDYLVFAPGSSGDGFFELFLRGGSAAELFNYPAGGELVLIKNIK